MCESPKISHDCLRKFATFIQFHTVSPWPWPSLGRSQVEAIHFQRRFLRARGCWGGRHGGRGGRGGRSQGGQAVGCHSPAHGLPAAVYHIVSTGITHASNNSASKRNVIFLIVFPSNIGARSIGFGIIFALAGLNLQARTLGSPPLPVRTQPPEMLRTARPAPRSCEASRLDQIPCWSCRWKRPSGNKHKTGTDLQAVPTCANMCQHVPTCANMCQHVPTRANMCQHVPTLQSRTVEHNYWAFHTKALHEFSKVKGTCEICRCK